MTDRKLDLRATMEAMDGMRFTLDGVAGTIRVYENRLGSLNFKHVASAAGRRSKTYREHKRMLGDDYDTDFGYETPDAVWEKAVKEGRFVYEGE